MINIITTTTIGPMTGAIAPVVIGVLWFRLS